MNIVCVGTVQAILLRVAPGVIFKRRRWRGWKIESSGELFGGCGGLLCAGTLSWRPGDRCGAGDRVCRRRRIRGIG